MKVEEIEKAISEVSENLETNEKELKEESVMYGTVDLTQATRENVAILRTCLKALENELERANGCDVCNENKVLDSCFIDEYRYISCGNDAGTHCDRNEYELSVRSGNMPMIQVCLKGEQCVDSNILEYKTNYCPSCGAKMKGENNDDSND